LDLILTISIVAIAIILLVFTRLRPDIVALIVLLALGLTGVVNQNQVFSGFSSSAVMTILGISMISVALQQTGAANAIGKFIHKMGKQSEVLTMLFVIIASATLSLFMNNIAAVGVLLPAVMSLSRKSKIPPARLMMPLAFGTILGGMATLLTTSNIIVSGALKDAGLPSFGLLDYFPVGAPVVVIGTLYLITLGRKLLPKQNNSDPETTPTQLTDRLKLQYSLEQNITRVRVLSSSPFVNKPIMAGEWSLKWGLEIVAFIRGKKMHVSPPAEMKIIANDVVLLRGSLNQTLAEQLGLLIETLEPGDQNITDEARPLAEVMITPHSRLIGKSLCEISFRAHYFLNVLGIWRQGKPIIENFSKLNLQFGDALLVQGSALHIHNLQNNQDLMLLEEDPDTVFRPKKIGLAILITLVTLTIAALDLMPVALVILTGAVLLILTGCMSITDAFQRIEWKAIFLIAGMWPLTIAIRESGLASIIVNGLSSITGSLAPIGIIALFLFLTMVFTQFLSGPVTPIVILPLALSAAQKVGIDPRAMAMAVALGCSLAFISPVSHPVNVMVMNPGGYTVKDYARVGFPLTILAFFTILLAIHFIWGL
jgi:di/tricarboxylate transporter